MTKAYISGMARSLTFKFSQMNASAHAPTRAGCLYDSTIGNPEMSVPLGYAPLFTAAESSLPIRRSRGTEKTGEERSVSEVHSWCVCALEVSVRKTWTDGDAPLPPHGCPSSVSPHRVPSSGSYHESHVDLYGKKKGQRGPGSINASDGPRSRGHPLKKPSHRVFPPENPPRPDRDRAAPVQSRLSDSAVCDIFGVAWRSLGMTELGSPTVLSES